jgi:hypothetical protein
MLSQLSYAPKIRFAVGSFSPNRKKSASSFYLFLNMLKKGLKKPDFREFYLKIRLLLLCD